METAIERKYALIRIRAGDYLLPDNDGKTLWRIAKYEDGPSHGLVDMKRDVTLWGYWSWANTFATPQTADDPTDWGYWEMEDGWCETRQEAIDRALRAKPRVAAELAQATVADKLARASDDYSP